MDELAKTGTAPPILAIMAALDPLLRAAIAARAASGLPTLAEDPLRGLHLSERDVSDLLAMPPGAPLLPGGEAGVVDWPALAAMDDRLAALVDIHRLEPAEIGALLLAMAPEIDQRYERVFAFLNDDVTRPAPTIGLVLRLLHATPAEVLAGRRIFAASAPLLAHRLLRIDGASAWPSAALRADPQLLRFVLEEGGLDARLAGSAQLLDPLPSPEPPPAEGPVAQALALVAQAARPGHGPAALHLRAPPGAEPRGLGRLLAGRLGRRLLAVDMARWPAAETAELGPILLREAWLFERLLLLDGIDGFREAHPAAFAELARLLARLPGPCLLAGAEPWRDEPLAMLGPVGLDLALDDPAARRRLWAEHLARHGVAPVAGGDLDTLAARFRLQPRQIATAAAELGAAALLDPAAAASLPGLAAAARRRNGHALEKLATRIPARRGWESLMLPPDTLAQLREIEARVALRGQVLDTWGFRARDPAGEGTVALFAGPSGTGKTLAAEVLAGALQLDLFRIDLARIVDKYIGETEKNLDRIFAAAEELDSVLLFDEADALFGKRSEVKDAHDRYANLEVAYLLQRMERYRGIAILATNLLHNLDEALIRRLSFLVHFPFPDEAMRARIWQACCPPAVPLAPEVDFAALAGRYRLSGGNIRNAVLAAAFLAAAEGGPLRPHHLEHAIGREYQKMGRPAAPGR